MASIALWLLIATAIGVGWLLGYFARKPSAQHRAISLEGMEDRIRFVIDSYSKENIDNFVQSLEVDKESLPMHLSIARHFRRNGEVEKAISIHQNVMSRPGIPSLLLHEVSFELAKDYMAAGLFDRAEALLIELKTSTFSGQSIRLLIDLYRKESEWRDALNEAALLDWKKDRNLAISMAQFCCELAAQEIRQTNNRDAYLLLKEALSYDKSCIRAYLCLAKLELQQKQFERCIGWLQKAFEKDPAFVRELIPVAKQCIPAIGEVKVHDLLMKWYQLAGAEILLIALAESFRQKGEYDKAILFLREQLSRNPKLKGVVRLLRYEAEVNPRYAESFGLAAQVGDLVLAKTNDYQCDHCGFSGSQLHWLCPSCKKWGRVKPSEFKLLD
jgi:lipopolysaccharide biosynthesis regulator YciM